MRLPGEALGLAAFDSLRAEDEPWLEQAFVPPVDFGLMTGMRSVAVFGRTGAGKTALRQALVRYAASPRARCLVAEPHIKPLPYGVVADSNVAQIQIKESLDACGMALLRHLAAFPRTFLEAPAWAQHMLVWFAHSFVQGEVAELLQDSLLDQFSEPGRSLLQSLRVSPADFGLRVESDSGLVLTELVKALREIGLNGLWFVIEVPEPWDAGELGGLAESLKALLGTMPLFERAGTALKLVLPAGLGAVLTGTSGIVRRRVDTYYLTWPPDRLIRLVESRLALASAGKVTTVAGLAAGSGLLTWLERCGGASPRGWLEYARLLFSTYWDSAASGRAQPLEQHEWKRVAKSHPPPLLLNEGTKLVTVGWREISDLAPNEFKLLSYLYRNSGRLCTRSELYYRALRELRAEPSVSEVKIWEAPKDWGPVLDTNLCRLRQAVDPDPADPLIIVTHRRRGVQLNRGEGSML